MREIREYDRVAIEELGIPSMVLMENAARAVTEIVCGLPRVQRGGGVLVLAGKGNNGGDGVAAARQLSERGVDVRVVGLFPEEELEGDAAAQWRIARAIGLRVRAIGRDVNARLRATLRAELSRPNLAAVADAVFGTGLSRPVPVGDAAAVAIRMLNGVGERGRASRPRVIAVDVPSGMDAETGAALVERAGSGREAVRADVTVTFVGLKRGMLAAGGAAKAWTGRVRVAPIGVGGGLASRLGERVARGVVGSLH